MAPRALGLGAVQITFVVVTSLASTLGTGASPRSTSRSLLLQIPIGVIGVPLGDRPPAVAVARRGGRTARGVRRPRRAGAPAAPVRDAPDRRASAIVLRNEIVGAAVRLRPVRPARVDADRGDAAARSCSGLAAHALIAVLARAFYARQDTRTPVAAAILAVVINTTWRSSSSGRSGWPGSASRSRSGPGSRRSSCSSSCERRVPELALRRVGVARRSGPRRDARRLRRSRSPLDGGLGLIGRTDPGRAALVVRIVDRRRRSGSASTCCSRSPCGSRSCPLSSRSWPTSSAARAERERSAADARSTRTTRPLGRLRRGVRTRARTSSSAVGRGQGRQRLVDGAARRQGPRRRSDRRPGARPAPATAAVGLRLRPARSGRRRLVARHGRGRSRHSPRPAARRSGRRRAGSPTSGSTPRSRATGRRTRTAPAAGAPGRRLPPGPADPARTRPGSSTWPPTRRRSGAISARSGAST